MLTFMLTSSIGARYIAGVGMEDTASWAALLFSIFHEPYIDINVNTHTYIYIYIHTYVYTMYRWKNTC